MTTKPYTWQEIEDFLKKELDKTKHIMTFGTIGSCNIERDIDVIVTKKPSSKASDFYKEYHSLFDNLDSFLQKKYSSRAARYPSMILEAFGKYLKSIGPTDLHFHNMVYISYHQMKKDWAWGMPGDMTLKEFLNKNYSLIIGSVRDVFSSGFKKSRDSDYLFNYLYMRDVLQSHFPKELLLGVMNDLFYYILTKRLGLKTLVAENEKEAKEYFYEICDVLDKEN